MSKTKVIRKLIERTKDDFVSYFTSGPSLERAGTIVNWAITGDPRLASCKDEVESMLPDTNQDGRWESSYALNTGLLIVCLIQYEDTHHDKVYSEAVTLFFDSVDFKVQQSLEAQGINHPSESQIQSHALYAAQRQWFKELKAAEMPNQAL